MSVCTFLAADIPLVTAAPSRDYPLHIDLDTGTVYDGGADDNYFLLPFPEVHTYTGKACAVCLEWHYTDGRAEQILRYIRRVLQHTDTMEVWHVWRMDCWAFEDRPVIHRKTVAADALTAAQLREIDEAEIWNSPDKQYPERPSFYCLTAKKWRRRPPVRNLRKPQLFCIGLAGNLISGFRDSFFSGIRKKAEKFGRFYRKNVRLSYPISKKCGIL